MPSDPTPLKRKHWYFIHRWFCVLCMKSEETRERRYGRKPADPAKRSTYIEGACGDHFA